MAKSWKERREEEAHILAEMEEAMKEQAKKEESAEETEKERTCLFCGATMKEKTCLVCGYSEDRSMNDEYKPMSEEKKSTVRFIIGAVCIIAFVLVYFVFNK